MKENNKGLIWLIVGLVFLVLGLVGYIVCDKVFLANTENKNTSTHEKNDNDRKVGDCYTVNGEKRCVLFKKDNIVFSENRSDIAKYYVNDNIAFDGRGTECSVDSAIVFDKNYLIIYCGADTLYPNIIDSNGKSPINFKKINEEGVFSSVIFKNDVLKLTRITYESGYEAALCRSNLDAIAYEEYEIKYKNNVFSDPKTVKTKTAEEIIKERYNMTCEEIKNSNDPAMEYHKNLATGV